jgi:lipopolysaccharide export system protein LptA
MRSKMTLRCSLVHYFPAANSFNILRSSTAQAIFASLALTLSCAVQALPEDSNKPIDVDASSATFDDATGITTLTGAVVVVQGTMTIKASKMVIHRNKQGDVSKMVATGSPAFFTQQQQKGQPHSKAWGAQMLYSIADQTVTITGNAKVEQLHDKINSEKIIYMMDKAIVKASGGKKRVTMVLQPKGKK